MDYASADKIIGDIKTGTILPVYVLHGAEPFYIDQVTSYIEANLLTEAEKAFNQSILYGREIDPKQVQDHARQFPMMAQRRLVILKEAQAMRDLKGLGTYIATPSPQTVLVIAHMKKIDGRIKWVKDAKKSAAVGVMMSEPVPEYKLNKWISNYVRTQKMKITPDATEMLAQYLGTDLKKVTNEIAKVKVNLPEGSTIDVAAVEKYIGISRDFDVFALLKAMSNGDTARVHQITYNLEDNAKVQPIQKIIPGMANYFERTLIVAQHFKKDDNTLSSMIGAYSSHVKEYRSMARRYGYKGLIKIYELIVEADAQSKGVERRRPDGLLKELIGKILLCQQAA